MTDDRDVLQMADRLAGQHARRQVECALRESACAMQATSGAQGKVEEVGGVRSLLRDRFHGSPTRTC